MTDVTDPDKLELDGDATLGAVAYRLRDTIRSDSKPQWDRREIAFGPIAHHCGASNVTIFA